MKIKLDENLPATLAHRRTALGHDVDTVLDEGLRGHSDPEVWRAAQTEARLLITQDLDFADRRRFVPGTHAGIVLVRLNHPSGRTISARIEAAFATEDVEAWRRAFVVLTDQKVRVLRPADQPT